MERFILLEILGSLGNHFSRDAFSQKDSNQVDTSETVYISSLALLKMLKHGQAGVPMEVEIYINEIEVFCKNCNHYFK